MGERKSHVKSIVGQKFGRLTCLRENGRDKWMNALWDFECECGNIVNLRSNAVKSGNTVSCGCYIKEYRRRKKRLGDYTGQKFNRWTFLQYHTHSKDGAVVWLMRCDCGVKKPVEVKRVRSGASKSCGCYSQEVRHRRCSKDLINQQFGKLTVLHLSQERSTKDGGNHWLCICECGNTRIVVTHRLTGGHVKHCICCGRLERSGAKHPNWNPNLTDQERLAIYEGRIGPEYQQWRREVFRRDNWTCQCCGIKGKQIEAHHLDGYAVFPDSRYDSQNGVTLCIEDHRAFHAIYGRGHNTRLQYEEWINGKVSEDHHV